ncbi:MAG: tetratricopeptide repeat protein [Pseudomonadota bacterium]
MRKSSRSVLSSIILASAVMLAAPSVMAQETTAPVTDEETASDERVLDTIEVTAIQQDAAMAAFQSGDFETAEVEFLDNAMCALRRERNLTASVENAQISTARAESFSDAVANNSGASTQGAGAGAAPQGAGVGIASVSGISANNVQTTYDRTCEKRGYQLYFAGLSQIQLGKTEEALRSFERATAASRILYDAHYKIGLIQILNGKPDRAKPQLRAIEGILKRCRNCEAKQEITERRDHLQSAIDGGVALQ